LNIDYLREGISPLCISEKRILPDDQELLIVVFILPFTREDALSEGHAGTMS
jgi:hypothetical protein